MASSKSVVIAALIANGAIAVLKFIGYLLTLSPAMLSETYHSVSDTGNQVFLLIGIRYSKRGASEKHPFGTGKAQFFYAFLVSVLLFGIAGWESAKHGYHALTHLGEAHGGSTWGVPFTDLGPYPGVWVNYIVLTGAIVFESYALWKANKGLTKEIAENDWDGYVEAFRKTPDITTLTAFTEDSIALAGAAIALVGVAATQVTGMPIFDAASSLVIGLLLMFFALALAWENKRLLLGESLPKEDNRELRRALKEFDGVTDVVDFRTVFFGPNQVVVTADIEFDPDMDTAEIDETITAMEERLHSLRDDVGRVYIEPEPTTTEPDRRGGPAPSPAGGED